MVGLNLIYLMLFRTMIDFLKISSIRARLALPFMHYTKKQWNGLALTEKENACERLSMWSWSHIITRSYHTEKATEQNPGTQLLSLSSVSVTGSSRSTNIHATLQHYCIVHFFSPSDNVVRRHPMIHDKSEHVYPLGSLGAISWWDALRLWRDVVVPTADHLLEYIRYLFGTSIL